MLPNQPAIQFLDPGEGARGGDAAKRPPRQSKHPGWKDGLHMAIAKQGFSVAAQVKKKYWYVEKIIIMSWDRKKGKPDDICEHYSPIFQARMSDEYLL